MRRYPLPLQTDRDALVYYETLAENARKNLRKLQKAGAAHERALAYEMAVLASAEHQLRRLRDRFQLYAG